MLLVMVESPYRDLQIGRMSDNILYARAAMRDAIRRGEAPFASHLLYTQVGVLDDALTVERNAGINIGYAWGDICQLHAFYTDRGWSEGMLAALARCTELKYEIEFRSLTGEPKLPPDPNRPLEQKA